MPAEQEVKKLYPNAWERPIAGGYNTTGWGICLFPKSPLTWLTQPLFVPDSYGGAGFIRKASAWAAALRRIKAGDTAYLSRPAPFVFGQILEWESPCPRNQLKAHRGKVIEVIPEGELPSRNNWPWINSPRNHESYLVREEYQDGTTALYWPLVKRLRGIA